MNQVVQFANRHRINALLCILAFFVGLLWIASSVNSQNVVAVEAENSVQIAAVGVQGADSLKRYGTLKVSASDAQSESASSPRVAIAADFDADGISDLLVAHNDRVVFHRGNINAFAPQTQEAWEAIRDRRFVSPFERKTRSIMVPAAVDFIFAGDFNRDAKLDAAFASRGDNILYILEGNGTGDFSNLRRIETVGAITALASGDVNRADGLTDLIVGTRNADAFNLQVFSGLGDIFAAGSLVYNLPSQAEAIVVGQLNENDFADIAVAVGSNIIVLSGADTTEPGATPPADMQFLPQTGSVKSLVVGDFLPDRDNRAELAALSADGTVRIFARGSLDTHPISNNEHLAEQVREYQSKGYPIPQRIFERLNAEGLRKPALRTSGDMTTWAEAETLAAAAPNLQLSPQSILTTGRMSDGTADDLIVLDQTANKVLVMPFQLDYGAIDRQNTYRSFNGKRARQEFNSAGSPIVALSLKLNYDNDEDLLVLSEGDSEPSAFISAPEAATFTVTTAVDNIDSNLGDGVCNGPSGCTLRAAIMEANRLAGDDTIMINAGINPVISRGQPDNDALGTNDQASGDLDITCVISDPTFGACNLPLASNDNDLSIMGAVGGNTISAGTFTPYLLNGGGSVNTDRVFDVGQDGVFGGGFGGSTGVSATFANLTIQNGNVRELVGDPNGGGNYAFGGGIRYDGFRSGGGHGTLTLTNTTINNNQSDNAGGGVYQVFGTFSASGSTFSGNITKAGEGGGLFFGAATSASNVNISSSTFSGNEARQGIVFGTFTANADGGGLRINADPNTVAIGTTNFTGNVAQQDGGAIKTLGALVTVTGGTMTGNTARRHGGVAFGDEDTANSPAFVTFSGSTMRGNTANSDNTIFAGDGSAGDGGAIFRDRGTLNITNVIIGGTGAGQPNTATNGGGVAHAFTVDSAPGNDSNQTAVTINNGSIIGNIATNDGGGVYHNALLFDVTASILNIGVTTAVPITDNIARNNGGGIHVSNAATATLNNMTLRSNRANSDTAGGGDGGALYQNIGTSTFTGTLTIGGSGLANSAVNGGGISNNLGTLTLPNAASITFNTASGNGGGINNGGTINNFTSATISNNSATGSGGGIATSGTLTTTGSTIANNSAGSGGGILVSGGTATFDGVTLTNNSAATGSGARLIGGTSNFNNTISISNNLDIAGGTLNFNTGAKTVGGNFTLSSGTFNAGSSTVNLAGNFIFSGGAFNRGTGTFNFNGSAAQTVSGTVIFNNLTVNNTSGVTLLSNETVDAALTLTNGALAVGSNTLTLNAAATATSGTLTSAANGTVVYNQGSNGQTVLAANYGNLTFSNFNKTLPAATVGIAGTFTPGTAVGHTITNNTIDFNGAGAQTIPAFNYNNLTSSNTGGRTLANTGTIGIAGTFTPGTNTYTITSSTINFNGAGGQTIPAFNYFNLTSSNVGARTLANSGTIGIAGAFTPGTNAYTIGTSTIEYNGTTAQTLPSSFTTYYNLTLNNPAGVTGFAGLTVQNLLRVAAGSLVSNGSTYNSIQIDSGATLNGVNATTINIGGSWTNNGTFTANGNTVNFNGSSAQAIGGTATTFNNLTINNASGVNLNSNATVGGALALTNGAFNVGAGNTLTLNAGATATGGTLTSAANGTVVYNQGSNGQTVLAANYGNLTFSNFNKTLPAATVGIAGTFTPGTAVGHTITNNTIDFNGAGAQTIPAFSFNNLTISQARGGATVTLANGGTINVAGTFSPTATAVVYSTIGNTFVFNGAGAQTIPTFTFNNLSTATGGTKTLGGTVAASGNLTIGTGTTLDASVSNFLLNVGGNWTNSGSFVPRAGSVAFNGTAAQSIGGLTTTFNNLTLNNAAGVTITVNTSNNGALTLTNGILSTGANTLTIAATGTTSRDGGCTITTCFVTSSTGGLRKQFDAATPSFVFTTGTTGGTDNGYTPVALANVTPTGTGELTVRAVDAVSPAPISTQKITRYWALTGSNLTADVSFTYLDGDIVGDETKYRVYREAINVCLSDCVNDATNTGTVTNVSSFSNWTIAEAVPTGASATINGRLIDSRGRGISKVKVALTGGNLTEPIYVLTDFLGKYRFENMPTGATYVVTPSSVRYRFKPSSRVQSLLEDTNGIDFVASRHTQIEIQ